MPTVLCNSIAVLAAPTGMLSLSAIDFLGERRSKTSVILGVVCFLGEVNRLAKLDRQDQGKERRGSLELPSLKWNLLK